MENSNKYQFPVGDQGCNTNRDNAGFTCDRPIDNGLPVECNTRDGEFAARKRSFCAGNPYTIPGLHFVGVRLFSLNSLSNGKR